MAAHDRWVGAEPSDLWNPLGGIGMTAIAAADIEVLGGDGIRNVRVAEEGIDYVFLRFDLVTENGSLANVISAYANGQYKSSVSMNSTSIVVSGLPDSYVQINLVVEPVTMKGEFGYLFQRPWFKDKVRLSWANPGDWWVQKYQLYSNGGSGDVDTSAPWASVSSYDIGHLASSSKTGGSGVSAKADSTGQYLWGDPRFKAEVMIVAGGYATQATFKYRFTQYDKRSRSIDISDYSADITMSDLGVWHALGSSGIEIRWTTGTFLPNQYWNIEGWIATSFGPTAVTEGQWQWVVKGVDQAMMSHSLLALGAGSTVGADIDTLPPPPTNLSLSFNATEEKFTITGSFNRSYATMVRIYSNLGYYNATSGLRDIPDWEHIHSDHVAISYQPTSEVTGSGSGWIGFSYQSGTVDEGKWRFCVRAVDADGHEEENINYLDMDLIGDTPVNETYPRAPRNFSVMPWGYDSAKFEFDLHASSAGAIIYATKGIITVDYNSMLTSIDRPAGYGWVRYTGIISVGTSWWAFGVRGRSTSGWVEANTDVIGSAFLEHSYPAISMAKTAEVTQ